MSYTVQSLAGMSQQERAVEALPPYLQRRMAMLILQGWIFKFDRSGWNSIWMAGRTYSDGTPAWERSAQTLMTLLNQMMGLVEDAS